MQTYSGEGKDGFWTLISVILGGIGKGMRESVFKIILLLPEDSTITKSEIPRTNQRR